MDSCCPNPAAAGQLAQMPGMPLNDERKAAIAKEPGPELDATLRPLRIDFEPSPTFYDWVPVRRWT